MTNLEKYNHVFKTIFDVPEDRLNESFTFQEIEEWDSVSHLALISKLEEEFDLLFESEDILHYESYEHGKEILNKMGIFFG